MGPCLERQNRRVVRSHHALRAACGAGSEHQVRRVVRLDQRLAFGLRIGACLGGQLHEGRPVHVGTRQHSVARHDDGLQRCRAQSCEQIGVVATQKIADAEKHARAAAVQNVGGFLALHAGVERHEHATCGMHAAGRDDPFAHVGQPDRDAVALLHAERHEGPCGLASLLEQACVADGFFAFDDGGMLVAITRGHFGQHLRQGLLLERIVVVQGVRHGWNHSGNLMRSLSLVGTDWQDRIHFLDRSLASSTSLWRMWTEPSCT